MYTSAWSSLSLTADIDIARVTTPIGSKVLGMDTCQVPPGEAADEAPFGSCQMCHSRLSSPTMYTSRRPSLKGAMAMCCALFAFEPICRNEPGGVPEAGMLICQMVWSLESTIASAADPLGSRATAISEAKRLPTRVHRG